MVAGYTPTPGELVHAAPDERLTIDPAPARIIFGANARLHCTTPTMFTAITVKVNTASSSKTVDVAAYTAGQRGPRDKYLTLATGIDASSTGTKTVSGLNAVFAPGWYWLAARVPNGVAIASCNSNMQWTARRSGSGVLNAFSASGAVYNIAVLPGSLDAFPRYESRNDAPIIEMKVAS